MLFFSQAGDGQGYFTLAVILDEYLSKDADSLPEFIRGDGGGSIDDGMQMIKRIFMNVGMGDVAVDQGGDGWQRPQKLSEPPALA